MFTLGVLTSNNWHYAVKICIASAVLGIGLLSLCMKVLFSLWLFRLEKKQDGYLQQLDEQLSDGYLEVANFVVGGVWIFAWLYVICDM